MKSRLFLLGLCMAALSSCKTEYITSAIFQNDVQYMAKPYSGDSVKHAVYASGALLVHSGDESGNSYATAGLLNIYQSHTFTDAHINLSYGVLGFAGNYERNVTGNNSPDFNKAFQGLGGNLSVSGYIPFNSVDWRVLGVDMVYTKEFGDFADYRKAALSTDDYTYITKTRLFTFGLFTELVVRNSAAVTTMYKLGFNNTPGEPHRLEGLPFNNMNFSASVNYRHLIFTGTLKAMPTDVFLLPSGIQIGAAYRFGK